MNANCLFIIVSLSVAFIGKSQNIVLQSRSLDSFYNSFSVQLHVGKDVSPNSSFNTYINDLDTKVIPSLQELGIKHVRDDINFYHFCNPCNNMGGCDAGVFPCLNYGNFTAAYDRMEKIYTQTGIRFQLVIPYRRITETADTFIINNPRYLNYLFNHDGAFGDLGNALNFVETLEGYNEVNVTYPNTSIFNTQRWAYTAFYMQKSVWDYMKNPFNVNTSIDPTYKLNKIPVISTSLYTGGGGLDPDGTNNEYNKLYSYGKDSISNNSIYNFTQGIALHAYPTDYAPLGHELYLEKNVDRNINGFTNAFATVYNPNPKPFYLTETGYHQGDKQTDNYNWIDENAASKYMSNIFPSSFAKGIVRTNVYELLDHGVTADQQLDQEANWGLVRRDGTKKPAFNMLKHFIAITTPTNYTHVPSALNFNVSGNTTDLQYLLLRKNVNVYQLLIWQGSTNGICFIGSGSNTNAGIILPTDSQFVAITLPAVAETVKTYSPYTSAMPSQSFSNVSVVNVGVPDNVLILDITFPNTTLALGFEDVSATIVNTFPHINWRVLDEDGVKEYWVERSVGNQNNFVVISASGMPAKNRQNNDYSFVDRTNDYTSGIVYYRIKLVKRNGSVLYSTIVNVFVENKNTIQISPNPVTDYVCIKGFAANNKQVKIVITNPLGVTVKSENVNVLNNQVYLKVNDLPKGLYFITVGDKKKNLKMLVN